VERITNSSLTDTQWLQASLPIKDGCLGVIVVCYRSPIPAAFLTSVAGTSLLQAESEILADCNVSEDLYWKDYLQLRSATGNETPDPLPSKQSSWDRPCFESGLSTPLQRSVFNAARLLIDRVTAGNGYHWWRLGPRFGGGTRSAR